MKHEISRRRRILLGGNCMDLPIMELLAPTYAVTLKEKAVLFWTRMHDDFRTSLSPLPFVCLRPQRSRL